ncbi:MAG: hypothetical protein ACODAA_04370 [Gemmatimonadota bacterium]
MLSNRVDRWLAGSFVALTVLLVAQVVVAQRTVGNAEAVWIADWAESPESVEEAVESAEQVVVGQVVRVRPGEDIVVRAEELPDGIDRIPTEIVTLRVEKNLKAGRGEPPQTVEVFRTGGTIGTPPSQRGNRPPEEPPEGVERPDRPDPPGDRNVKLNGDPPYERGERYVLMLERGPEMRVNGRSVRAERPVSPEGRYRVGRGGEIEPVSERAEFARELRGRSLEAFEQQIERGVGRGR